MKLRINEEKLKIEFGYLEKVLALKRSFEIPLEHILKVTITVPKTSCWKEIRVPGTYLPGIVKAGTYYTPRGKEFWYVTRSEECVVIELKDEPYRRIILSMEKIKNYVKELTKLFQIPLKPINE